MSSFNSIFSTILSSKCWHSSRVAFAAAPSFSAFASWRQFSSKLCLKPFKYIFRSAIKDRMVFSCSGEKSILFKLLFVDKFNGYNKSTLSEGELLPISYPCMSKRNSRVCCIHFYSFLYQINSISFCVESSPPSES